jgi:hypothetical protein
VICYLETQEQFLVNPPMILMENDDSGKRRRQQKTDTPKGFENTIEPFVSTNSGDEVNDVSRSETEVPNTLRHFAPLSACFAQGDYVPGRHSESSSEHCDWCQDFFIRRAFWRTS